MIPNRMPRNPFAGHAGITACDCEYAGRLVCSVECSKFTFGTWHEGTVALWDLEWAGGMGQELDGQVHSVGSKEGKGRHCIPCTILSF